jgi:hypothetical protein
MAHFAKLNENNVVTQVIAVDNNELLDNGVESESKGIAFCENLFGGRWIQTSYNSTIRYNYAGIDYTYDENNDAFVEPMLTCGHSELTLNTATYRWECTSPEHDIEL